MVNRGVIRLCLCLGAVAVVAAVTATVALQAAPPPIHLPGENDGRRWSAMLLVSNADENNSLEAARTSVESMNLWQKSEVASVASDESRMAVDIVPGARWTEVLSKKATSTKQIEDPESLF